MINEIFDTIQKVLNAHIQNQFTLSEDIVVVNSLNDQNGSPMASNENKVVITLVNIHEESNHRYYGENPKGGTQIGSPMHLNLYILCTVNFNDYNESLKLLSAVIEYFSAHPMLNHQNCSNLPNAIERISFEMESLNREEVSQLYAVLGANYRPSVSYKIRSVSIGKKELNQLV